MIRAGTGLGSWRDRGATILGRACFLILDVLELLAMARQRRSQCPALEADAAMPLDLATAAVTITGHFRWQHWPRSRQLHHVEEEFDLLRRHVHQHAGSRLGRTSANAQGPAEPPAAAAQLADFAAYQYLTTAIATDRSIAASSTRSPPYAGFFREEHHFRR